MTEIAPLPGQDTLLACWKALTPLSPSGRLTTVQGAVAAMFPESAYLNNAILTDTDDSTAAAVGAACEFNAADRLREINGLERDITTLVMYMTVPPGLPHHDGVARASIAAIELLALDQPVPVAELGTPDPVPGLTAWVMVEDDLAVASAYTYLRGTDCGIYAVGTVPGWRRRGLARSLVEHALADARDRGAQTASLQSTPMGQPLYESLGFQPAGRYEEWVARPAAG